MPLPSSLKAGFHPGFQARLALALSDRTDREQWTRAEGENILKCFLRDWFTLDHSPERPNRRRLLLSSAPPFGDGVVGLDAELTGGPLDPTAQLLVRDIGWEAA